jgi:hypothetical protein
MNESGSSKDRLAAALQRVIELRRHLDADPELGEKWRAVKQFQSELLRRTYADLFDSPRFRPACQFFLAELYGAKDFEQRDLEVLRVVPMLVRMLPERAVHTLALAVELDELSEQLDARLARVVALPIDDARYAAAYRAVGTPEERAHQIEIVDTIGHSLDRLARIPFLAPMLHMMRAPAEAAGLGHLQHFLETGFDAFKTMNGAGEFLDMVRQRQTVLSERLFAGGKDVDVTTLGRG